MKYDTITFEFSRDLTQDERRIFQGYFQQMYMKVKKSLEWFVKEDAERQGTMPLFVRQKIVELTKVTGMDIGFIIKAKSHAILYDYEKVMVLDRDEKNPRRYTFMVAKDCFQLDKTGVSFIDEQYLNLFNKTQTQIVNEVRRQVFPRIHIKSHECFIEYGIRPDIPEENN